MNIGFLCSNNKSSLVQRLLRENQNMIKRRLTIITTNTSTNAFTEQEYTSVTVKRINWSSNKEGSLVLHNLLAIEKIELVICLFDKIIDVLDNDFSKTRMINLHPSLLPSFKGMNAVKNAEQAGVLIQGATLHEITEEVDGGRIIGQVAYCSEKEDKKLQRQKRHDAEYKLVESYLKGQLVDKNDILDDKKEEFLLSTI